MKPHLTISLVAVFMLIVLVVFVAMVYKDFNLKFQSEDYLQIFN